MKHLLRLCVLGERRPSRKEGLGLLRQLNEETVHSVKLACWVRHPWWV
jgi:hypothetical protein